MNAILLGNQVFGDNQVKMSRICPKCNDWCPSKDRERDQGTLRRHRAGKGNENRGRNWSDELTDKEH